MLTLWIYLCKAQIILSALHFVVKGGRANHYCILPKSKIQTHVTYLKCIVHNIWQHTNNYIHRFGKGNHKRPKAEVSNLYQMNWIIIKIPFNVLIKFEDFCFCMKLGWKILHSTLIYHKKLTDVSSGKEWENYSVYF